MTTRAKRKNAERILYGPTVQYPGDRTVPGQPLDTERLLAAFERLDPDLRRAWLCALAHNLTVATRTVVYDPPVTETGLDRIKSINEALHQLTSCANPRKSWSAHDQALLLRDIIEHSFDYGYDWAVGSVLAPVLGKNNESRVSSAIR